MPRSGQYRIETWRKMGEAGPRRQIGRGTPQQALALALRNRFGGAVQIGARLDLDEDDDRAAPGDDVDLAASAGSGGNTAFENGIAFEAQHQRCDKFGPSTEGQGGQFTSPYHAAKLGAPVCGFNRLLSGVRLASAGSLRLFSAVRAGVRLRAEGRAAAPASAAGGPGQARPAAPDRPRRSRHSAG